MILNIISDDFSIPEKSALIIGASGLVGSRMFNLLQENHWNVFGTYHKNKKNNLLNFSLCRDLITSLPLTSRMVKYGIICSTYGSIDSCKKNPLDSYKTNVGATLRLIDNMVCCGMKPVFLSTDYVFSGHRGNYNESDTPDPVTVYGRQKAEVEKIMLAHHPDSLIIRLSKIFSTTPADNSLLSQWFNAILTGKIIRCASDQHFCPTLIDDVVQGIHKLLKKNASGIYHLCQPHKYTLSELLEEFIAHLKLVSPKISECKTSDFNFEDNRSKDTSMCPEKFIRKTAFTFTSMENCFSLFQSTLAQSA